MLIRRGVYKRARAMRSVPLNMLSQEEVLKAFPKPETYYKNFLKNIKQKHNTTPKFPNWALGKLKYNHLTDSQLKAFTYITENLQKKSLRVCLLAGPGKGKSFTLGRVRNYLEIRKVKFAILCLLGSSACNAGGVTVNHYFELGRYMPENLEGLVEAKVSKTLAERVANLKVLLVDEIGTISADLFYFIVKRLEFILQSNLQGIICSGDFGQLLCRKIPLLENPEVVSDDFAKKGLQLFQSFKVITLKENVRQSGDLQFQKVIEAIQQKQITPEIFNLLKQRHISSVTKEEIERFDRDAVKIFPLNKYIDEYHAKLLAASKDRNIVIPTKVVPKSSSLSFPPLVLSPDVRIMLKRNLFVEKGLVSGSLGNVIAVYYKRSQKANVHFPLFLLCRFDSYQGETVELGCVPILPEKESVYDPVLKRKVTKKFFPVKLAEAISAHSSQGLSIPEGVQIHLEPFERFYSYLLTSISRTDKLENVLLTGEFDYSYFTSPSFYRGHKWYLERLANLLENEV